MSPNLRYRVLVILALTLASIWALWPRETIERVRDRQTGAFRYDTVKRVPLKKGLDLQGGMHLALEVDESKGVVQDKAKALENALKVIRNRIDQFGVSEPVVQKVGNDRIIVELPGIDDPERATSIVEKSAYLEFQITDETGALEKALPRIDAALKQKGVTVAAAGGTPADTQSNRGVGQLFTPGADSGKAKTDSTNSDSIALAQGGAFSSALQQGQMPGQFLVNVKDVPRLEQYLAMPEVRAALPPGRVLRWQSDTTSYGNQWYRALYVLDARPIITGDVLVDAQPATDPIEGTLVTFQLNNEGGRRFRNETGRHIKDYMAIVLDERVMGQPPIIQSAIGTRGQITMGGKGIQAAQDLALVLRAGALPVPLKVAEARTIGASLGEDSIRKGLRAGVLAVVLVIVTMVVYYRFAGVLAVSALALYVLYTLATLAGFDAVLTLPGLAGFVLSIGIAVDANVLIFERIREELDHGKTVRTAIDEGYRHAMSAIIDSNVSTILTATVLYQFGTGPVRGFAVTLIAGIVASMVTSIFVTRTFFLLWLNRTRGAQTLSI